MLAKSKELIIIIIIFGIAGLLFFLGLARYKNNVDARNKAASEANKKTEEVKNEIEIPEEVELDTLKEEI